MSRPPRNPYLFQLRLNQIDDIIRNAPAHDLIAMQADIGEPLYYEAYGIYNGYDYERYCAMMLSENGFHDVDVTPSSRDFGADIIAYDQGGWKWVFQCKMYSAKVGNSPVQEVVAAKAHYNAVKAGIITTVGLTEAAQELANENNVAVIVTHMK